MTTSAFDPICLGQYHYIPCPKMLHFQWEGSENIYRYVLAEVIPVAGINSETRRKEGEVKTEGEIANSYLKNPVKGE